MRIAPRASRNGSTSPLGKLGDSLKGSRIEGEIRDRFNRKRAAITKKPEAEVVRDFVRVAALGRDEAVRMYGEGVLVVFRMLDGMPDDKPISR